MVTSVRGGLLVDDEYRACAHAGTQRALRSAVGVKAHGSLVTVSAIAGGNGSSCS
jgi:hypothetical protein